MHLQPPTALAAALLMIPTLALAQHDHGHGAKHGSSEHAAAPAARPAPGTVEMSVTSEGFVPASIRVQKGEKVRLRVTRKTERTCATEIVIRDAGINQKLPLDQPVIVEFTPKKAGTLRYACGMDMISGVLIVD